MGSQEQPPGDIETAGVDTLVSVFEEELTPSDRNSLRQELLQQQEDTRSFLAKALILLSCGSFLCIFLMAVGVLFIPNSDSQPERYGYAKDVAGILITSQTGLLGAVLGFYFGSRSKEGSEQS